MWMADPQRVRLLKDLTKYHEHLVPGVEGIMVPNVKTTPYGNFDRFGAVKFDCCGHLIDILLTNLEFIFTPEERNEFVEDVKGTAAKLKEDLAVAAPAASVRPKRTRST